MQQFNAENAKMTPLTPVEPINLSHFAEEFFRQAIRRGVQAYVAHFGERLVAIYVRGSVHRNEAVPGVSDLDMHAVIADAPLSSAPSRAPTYSRRWSGFSHSLLISDHVSTA